MSAARRRLNLHIEGRRPDGGGYEKVKSIFRQFTQSTFRVTFRIIECNGTYHQTTIPVPNQTHSLHGLRFAYHASNLPRSHQQQSTSPGQEGLPRPQGGEGESGNWCRRLEMPARDGARAAVDYNLPRGRSPPGLR